MRRNVPAVMLLKSLVSHFANPHSGWLTLAMASTLAGNLTITGSVANMDSGCWDSRGEDGKEFTAGHTALCRENVNNPLR